MKRFKRICKKCGKLYSPNDLYGRQCDECKSEAMKRAKINRKKNMEKKRKTKGAG